MPYTVSSVLRRAIYSEGTERTVIALAEVSSPSFGSPLRFTTDGRPTVHNGQTYEPFGFQIQLPDDREASQPRAIFAVPNVSHEIVALLRSIEGPADVRLTVVLDDNPNRIERGPWDFKLTGVTYDRNFVRGTLQPDTLLNEPYPSQVYNTIDYPGF